MCFYNFLDDLKKLDSEDEPLCPEPPSFPAGLVVKEANGAFFTVVCLKGHVLVDTAGRKLPDGLVNCQNGLEWPNHFPACVPETDAYFWPKREANEGIEKPIGNFTYLRRNQSEDLNSIMEIDGSPMVLSTVVLCMCVILPIVVATIYFLQGCFHCVTKKHFSALFDKFNSGEVPQQEAEQEELNRSFIW